MGSPWAFGFSHHSPIFPLILALSCPLSYPPSHKSHLAPPEILRLSSKPLRAYLGGAVDASAGDPSAST